ncbi:hypothetical protein ABZ921_19680 [Streptomyces atriruber]|uniref:GerMN domain-containing protein n=1 Tax=Streptomyces atriruber TaxID=545121 RepID=A0ABV3BPA9_9ACTN
MTLVRVRRGAGVALAVVALGLAGCGVQPTGVVDAGEAAGGLTKGLRIYFVSETGRLEGVTRALPISEPAAVIKLLMSGPSKAEQQTGLTTLIDSGRFDVTGKGNRITVRTPDLVLDPAALDDRNRTGQLVCSLARARAVLDERGRTRPDDVRVTVIPEGGGELGPYVCSDFLK